jgi:hypothetical protein
MLRNLKTTLLAAAQFPVKILCHGKAAHGYLAAWFNITLHRQGHEPQFLKEQAQRRGIRQIEVKGFQNVALRLPMPDGLFIRNFNIN